MFCGHITFQVYSQEDVLWKWKCYEVTNRRQHHLIVPLYTASTLAPWAARGADDVGRGGGTSCLAPRRGSGRARSAREWRTAGWGGGVSAEEGGPRRRSRPCSRRPLSPPSFPGYLNLSRGVGALADRPAPRFASSPAAAAAAWTAPGPTPQPVGPSRALGPNAWESRAEWVAVVGAVPGAPGGERGCCAGASSGDRVWVWHDLVPWDSALARKKLEILPGRKLKQYKSHSLLIACQPPYKYGHIS